MKKPRMIRDIEKVQLRQWCIEQAIRWPDDRGNYNQVMSQGGSYKADVDIVARTKKIEAYVDGK